MAIDIHFGIAVDFQAKFKVPVITLKALHGLTLDYIRQPLLEWELPSQSDDQKRVQWNPVYHLRYVIWRRWQEFLVVTTNLGQPFFPETHITPLLQSFQKHSNFISL